MFLGRQRMQIKGYRPGHRRYAPGPSNQAPSNPKLQPPTSLQNCFYVGYAEVTGDLVRPTPPVGPGAPTAQYFGAVNRGIILTCCVSAFDWFTPMYRSDL